MLKEGRLLLSNLETVKAAKREAEEEQEIQADMETVQRCCSKFQDHFLDIFSRV